MAPTIQFATLAVLFTSVLAIPAKDKHHEEHKGSPTLPFIPTGTGSSAEQDAAPKFGKARRGNWKPHWEIIPGIHGQHPVPSGTLPTPTGTAPIPTGTASVPIPKVNL
ncbi:uncharacterized protein MYCFIDRAFT_197940 [Pseudocercospora fijiensis CIRAD86]|uniref:Uncharacterized protein n=1 Tax=Pseudocercospora fijiensis (strain CIRAD86) TaxID=383855 RepID=M3AVG3_PSEFD|nr:uncharacterized protein MYCFIDRAFT_197940 [Pseudocercospora fijiensis CIRAD86]EME81138.1 hypothetical protein MYCFIDRAFT_197940 [Pseudocercospora fijiensis CIRAD86]